jgi:hypothetical protein
MTRNRLHIILFVVFYLICLVSAGQRLIPGSKMVIVLSDSSSVILYRAVTSDHVNNACYYLPVNFRISERAGKPEFSFISYDSDEDGKNDGAIMHLLLTWGLTEEQQTEAEKLIRGKVDSTLYLSGCPLLSEKREDIRFDIHGDNPLCEVLRESLRSKGSPPLSPGEKLALSFMFSSGNTEKIELALKSPDRLKGIFFDLTYSVSGNQGLDTLLLRGDFRKWMNTIR